MDAGVLHMNVVPHQADYFSPMRLGDGEQIKPSLTATAQVTRCETVTLVVPTFFNGGLKRHSLRYLLDGIERSTAIEEVVLVVSDDEAGSYADLAPLVAGKKFVITTCEAEVRAKSRNIGVGVSTSRNLMFLDDDMLVKDWRSIDVILSAILTQGYDCALFPRRQYAKFPLLYEAEALKQLIDEWRTDEHDVARNAAFLDPINDGASHKTMTFCFPGCFTLIKRRAFDDIGGFPEGFRGWGFEDVEFAMAAVNRLKILNLFRKSEPLLHIDHPVSPYKTAEYKANYDRFTSSFTIFDLDLLCRNVFDGKDLGRVHRTREDRSIYFQPLRDLFDSRRLPFDLDGTLENYSHIVERRLDRDWNPVPEFVVLHGSRARGTAESGSDYDVLFLFHGGAEPEFFTSATDGGRVEFEYSDFGKFEEITNAPAYNTLFGPFELSKLVDGVAIWGDADKWVSRRDDIIQRAVRLGRPIWLVFAFGMSFSPEKYGEFAPRYRSALRFLFEKAADPRYERDVEVVQGVGVDRATFGSHVAAVMDEDLPGWRDDVAANHRVFACQLPEEWTALRWIVEHCSGASKGAERESGSSSKASVIRT